MNTNGIYLCKPKGDIISALNVDVESVSLTEAVSDLWELSFTIHHYGDGVENPYYDSLNEMMELYLVSEDCTARFLIDAEPAISTDGYSEIKNVTAHSIEAELQYKYLSEFQINTGKEISQENLVKGGINRLAPLETGETLYDYNINPYTELPIDYITVSCRLGAELQAFYDTINVTGNTVQWQWTFNGKDSPTTITAQFSTTDGSLTGDPLLLSKWLTEFTNKYPRMISDIFWGVDNRQNSQGKSKTWDEVVCVTEQYIATRTDIEGITTMYIPYRTYKITNTVITYNATHTYSFQNFKDGIQSVIAFYNRYGDQLSLLDIVLERAKATDWSVGDVPDNVAVKKYSFEIDNQDIYSFLMNNISHTMKVIIDFDRVAKKVHVIDLSVDDTKYETGIMTGFQNLVQSIDIQTSSDDGIKTTFKPKGANDLGITYVNFGSDKITNLDFFMNKVDKNDEYQYGTEELHDKYKDWKRYREEYTKSITDVPQYNLNFNTKTLTTFTTDLNNTRKKLYIELSTMYNQLLRDINELTYLVPSDGAITDYTTFPLEDLQKVLKAYLNAYNALLEIYKTEFPNKPIEETYLYADYTLYKNTIIPNLENALRMYALTDEYGNFLKEDGVTQTTILDELYYPDGGNPVYNANGELVTKTKTDPEEKFGKSEEYLYDLSLYGLSELNAKKKGWVDAAAQIYKEAFVKSGLPGTPECQYNEWSDLSDNQKTGFVNKSSYLRQLNQYWDYMSTDVRENGLTHKHTKGVVLLANEEIDRCETCLSQLNDMLETIGEYRSQIANEVTYEGWNDPEHGYESFTEKELSILHTLSHEADYVNENILVTNIESIVDAVKVEQELLEDAEKRLYEKSRPQYSFTASLDNIFALDGFAPMKDHLKLLNYFYLKYGLYDDETIKLRIVKMVFNPIVKTEDFTLEFSNMTYTLEGLSDYYYLFEENSGVSTGGGSSSSSSSGGTYGTNDAEITLSNNMLNALLKNDMTANSLNIDNLLTVKQIENLIVDGDLTVNGAAITNVIKSQNYNGTNNGIDNTEGSIIRLIDGNFNLGGKGLVFDNTVDPPTLTMNNGTIIGGMIKSSNGKSYIDLLDGSFNFGGYFTYQGNHEPVYFTLENANFEFRSSDIGTLGHCVELEIGNLNSQGYIGCHAFPEKYNSSGIHLRTIQYNSVLSYGEYIDPSCYIRPNGIQLKEASLFINDGCIACYIDDSTRIVYDEQSIHKEEYSGGIWHIVQRYLSFT